MAKAPPAPQASSSKSVPQPQPKKRAAAFEIDDIFASKKSKPSAAPSAPSAPPAAANAEPSASKKKKNKGKGKADVGAMDVEQEDAEMKEIGDAIKQAKAQRVPQTIVDSSASIEAYRPAPPTLGKKRKAGETIDEADEKFMDSRGTRRRTDDGLAIYDIAELKIGLGGDTPECPFDCQCCF
ncbi:hypothetical protein BCR35DRAFT_306819 [Leucosporidium creatinivorum]|uniref:DUF1764-domain-containing protein n=1 Tax=Leucosporidium creatinivorum TaxID=106004 RepID=A0A1Y2ER25_9BASI|nr:hypothetical protein BCR35DRAFT_306819 [Leucosporidium creatinivorum]